MNTKNTSDILLRIGVAFAFLYPPINAIFNPDSWIGYFPKFVHGIVPDLVLLHGLGVVEVIIALWILSGKKIFFPSLIAGITIISIVLFNLNNFEVLFRDLSIAMVAFALALNASDTGI
ncbi:MAG: hypothetical protein HY228_00645 [Candidatus Yonathbacteria bacterium]|nr:hypothetical protein [Candidatus Yonathbacteria bacterium]